MSDTGVSCALVLVLVLMACDTWMRGDGGVNLMRLRLCFIFCAFAFANAGFCKIMVFNRIRCGRFSNSFIGMDC